MNNFVDHVDPTKSLGSTNIQAQYNKLTDQEKLLVGAKLLGMNHLPVSFDQFISDDYYLGNPAITNHGNAVFSIWKEAGKKIFPTPITTKYPYVSFGGCIGSGKSTMSRFIGLYTFHRLDCCVNPFLSLGLAGGTKLGMGFFHANEQTANKDFVQYFKTVFEISPYFRNQYNKPPIRLISSGPKSVGGVIGVNLIFSILSEIGFWKPTDAMSKMSEVLTRYQSRFISKRFTFGSVIIDSSAKDADHSVADKFEEAVPEEELFIAKFSHWVARPELYYESNNITFDFYRGDSVRTPHVIEDDEKTDELDKDRIIKCPIQVKRNFMLDPIRSLQDLAGFPYSGKELFFNGSISHLVACSKIPNLCPDIIKDIDFFDLNDSIYNRVSPMLLRLPKGVTLFIHFDIGIVTDNTGIAICYYDGEDKRGPENYGKASYPRFKFPLILGLSRKDGQKTSLDHLFQFVQRLSIDYDVHVSADGFASAGLFQSCERAGIEYKAISVDKTTEPYFMFKNIVNSERATLVYNETLLRECSELRIVTTGKNGTHIKIDHPEFSGSFEYDYAGRTGEKPGTKDISDAVVGSLWACYEKYSEFLEEGAGGVNKQLSAIKTLSKSAREEAGQAIQNMLESIF